MCLPVWRELKHLESSFSEVVMYICVHMCLPVWRELKLCACRAATSLPSFACSHVPSRLEGIETVSGRALSRQFGGVHMCLPVWRELKRVFIRHRTRPGESCSHVPSRLEGIETRFRRRSSDPFLVCSHVPSRLEGIETRSDRKNLWLVLTSVHMCLPVWRELKPVYSLADMVTVNVHMCLPVWRELKRGVCAGVCASGFVHMCLPVWRELKLLVISALHGQ